MAEAATPLTYDDVVQAAQVIASAGRKASSVAVREKLGRGSFSTIRKHLDRWQIDQEPMTVVPAPPVPPQLESLWQEARREAENRLVADRDALNRLSEQLDQRWSDIEAEVRAAEFRREQAEVRVADKDAEIARLVSVIEDLRQQRERAEGLQSQSVDELHRERARWATQLDALEGQLGDLTRVLRLITEPVASLPKDIEEVGARVEVGFAQFRKELSDRGKADSQLLVHIIGEPITRLSFVVDEVRRNIEKQRRVSFHPRGNARHARTTAPPQFSKWS